MPKSNRNWLRLCPFCGGSAVVAGGDLIPEPQFDNTGEYIGMGVTADCETTPAYVECTKCRATGPEFNQDDGDIKNAIRAWNRRFYEP